VISAALENWGFVTPTARPGFTPETRFVSPDLFARLLRPSRLDEDEDEDEDEDDEDEDEVADASAAPEESPSLSSPLSSADRDDEDPSDSLPSLSVAICCRRRLRAVAALMRGVGPGARPSTCGSTEKSPA
jgi:hypothetical protein